MKFLFFDIECCNSIPLLSKVCSLGYVLTDENLNIIKEEDMLINPNSRFITTWSKGKKSIELKHKEEVFRRQRNFPYKYNYIKKILEDKDTMVFGFAVTNDNTFIIDELLSYKLQPINYMYYDLQSLVKEDLNITNDLSLSKLNEHYNVREQNEAHESLEDAQICFDLVKDLTLKHKCGVVELVEKFNSCKGEVINYEMVFEKEPRKYTIETALRMKRTIALKNERNLDKFDNIYYFSNRDKKYDKTILINLLNGITKTKNAITVKKELCTHHVIFDDEEVETDKVVIGVEELIRNLDLKDLTSEKLAQENLKTDARTQRDKKINEIKQLLKIAG